MGTALHDGFSTVDSAVTNDDIMNTPFATKATLNFVASHQSKGPFFLWLNDSLPHGPHNVADAPHTDEPEDMPGIQRQAPHHRPNW
jgi:hypothetical protein